MEKVKKYLEEELSPYNFCERYKIMSIYRYVNELDRWVNLCGEDNTLPIDVILPNDLYEELVEELCCDVDERKMSFYLRNSIEEMSTKRLVNQGGIAIWNTIQ